MSVYCDINSIIDELLLLAKPDNIANLKKKLDDYKSKYNNCINYIIDNLAENLGEENYWILSSAGYRPQSSIEMKADWQKAKRIYDREGYVLDYWTEQNYKHQTWLKPVVTWFIEDLEDITKILKESKHLRFVPKLFNHEKLEKIVPVNDEEKWMKRILNRCASDDSRSTFSDMFERLLDKVDTFDELKQLIIIALELKNDKYKQVCSVLREQDNLNVQQIVTSLKMISITNVFDIGVFSCIRDSKLTLSNKCEVMKQLDQSYHKLHGTFRFLSLLKRILSFEIESKLELINDIWITNIEIIKCLYLSDEAQESCNVDEIVEFRNFLNRNASNIHVFFVNDTAKVLKEHGEEIIRLADFLNLWKELIPYCKFSFDESVKNIFAMCSKNRNVFIHCLDVLTKNVTNNGSNEMIELPWCLERKLIDWGMIPEDKIRPLMELIPKWQDAYLFHSINERKDDDWTRHLHFMKQTMECKPTCSQTRLLTFLYFLDYPVENTWPYVEQCDDSSINYLFYYEDDFASVFKTNLSLGVLCLKYAKIDELRFPFLMKLVLGGPISEPYKEHIERYIEKLNNVDDDILKYIRRNRSSEKLPYDKLNEFLDVLIYIPSNLPPDLLDYLMKLVMGGHISEPYKENIERYIEKLNNVDGDILKYILRLLEKLPLDKLNGLVDLLLYTQTQVRPDFLEWFILIVLRGHISEPYKENVQPYIETLNKVDNPVLAYRLLKDLQPNKLNERLDLLLYIQSQVHPNLLSDLLTIVLGGHISEPYKEHVRPYIETLNKVDDHILTYILSFRLLEKLPLDKLNALVDLLLYMQSSDRPDLLGVIVILVLNGQIAEPYKENVQIYVEKLNQVEDNMFIFILSYRLLDADVMPSDKLKVLLSVQNLPNISSETLLMILKEEPTCELEKVLNLIIEHNIYHQRYMIYRKSNIFKRNWPSSDRVQFWVNLDEHFDDPVYTEIVDALPDFQMKPLLELLEFVKRNVYRNFYMNPLFVKFIESLNNMSASVEDIKDILNKLFVDKSRTENLVELLNQHLNILQQLYESNHKLQDFQKVMKYVQEHKNMYMFKKSLNEILDWIKNSYDTTIDEILDIIRHTMLYGCYTSLKILYASEDEVWRNKRKELKDILIKLDRHDISGVVSIGIKLGAEQLLTKLENLISCDNNTWIKCISKYGQLRNRAEEKCKDSFPDYIDFLDIFIKAEWDKDKPRLDTTEVFEGLHLILFDKQETMEKLYPLLKLLKSLVSCTENFNKKVYKKCLSLIQTVVEITTICIELNILDESVNDIVKKYEDDDWMEAMKSIKIRIYSLFFKKYFDIEMGDIRNNTEGLHILATRLNHLKRHKYVNEKLNDVLKKIFTMYKQIHENDEHLLEYILYMNENQLKLAEFYAHGYSRELWTSEVVVMDTLNERKPVNYVTEYLQIVGEYKDMELEESKDMELLDDESFRKQFNQYLSIEQMEENRNSLLKALNISESKYEERLKEIEDNIQRLITSDSKASAPLKPKTFKIKLLNNFWESISCCNDKIPGCYAPSGIHCEKPIINAINVDSTFLSLQNNKHLEVENAEIKIFSQGLYIFPLHQSTHEYATDQLWIRMLKLLLDKFVPVIILESGAPGYQYLKDNNITPVLPVNDSTLNWRGSVFPHEYTDPYDELTDCLIINKESLDEINLPTVNVKEEQKTKHTEISRIKNQLLNNCILNNLNRKQKEQVLKKFFSVPRVHKLLKKLEAKSDIDTTLNMDDISDIDTVQFIKAIKKKYKIDIREEDVAELKHKFRECIDN